MDFGLTDAQQEMAELARRILADKVTDALLREVDAGQERFDPGTWDALARAGLLGVGLPEDVGGGGYGIVEQCLLLEEIGRVLAPVPFLASITSAAAPIAAFGSAEQKSRWAARAADGSAVLTAALVEPLNPDPLRPGAVAVPDAGGWRLSGVKTAVPAAGRAELIVVPASLGEGVGVFLVEPATPGVTIGRQQTTNGDAAGYVELDDVRVDAGALLGSPSTGRDILRWTLERATVGVCALQLGICEQALADTAAYTTSRVQFDRPIATFQAVGHRCADAYIDTEAVRLTLWQAAWRLSEGLPASTEVEVAKFWAAEAGHRVAHTAVHLHGGMGVASEYRIHRYFVWAKQAEFTLGGATEQLLRIGATLAAG